jgi:DNA-binding NarL/FixJ family response regulator
MKTREIRILIADDHPIVREGFARVLARDPAIQVVGEASDGGAAVEQVMALRPDVAVVDLSMPVKDGLAVTRAVKDAQLPTQVILLTMHNDRSRFNAALDAGVAGYLLKESAPNEIVQAIHTVAAGGHYISPALSTHLLKRRSDALELVEDTPTLAVLTETERRVLRLVADGRTSRDIAAQLFVSVRTVEDHRANVCQKLRLHGSNALLKFAMAHRSELAGI